MEIYVHYHELEPSANIVLENHQKCHTSISNNLILEFPLKQNENAVVA